MALVCLEGNHRTVVIQNKLIFQNFEMYSILLQPILYLKLTYLHRGKSNAAHT